MWRKENLLNHQKVLKYYEHDCRIQRAINESVEHRYDSDGNVMKLATYSLARDTYKLLNKNLNFIPTPNVYSKQKRDTELQNFYRLVKLKRYFQNKQNQLPTDENQSKKRTK